MSWWHSGATSCPGQVFYLVQHHHIIIEQLFGAKDLCKSEPKMDFHGVCGLLHSFTHYTPHGSSVSDAVSGVSVQ